MPIPDVLDFAHDLAGRAIEDGGFAIDATVGNGHDTLFLAKSVGGTGRVLGFDVQQEAVESTRKRLDAQDALAPVHLVQAGHESMTDHIGNERTGEVDVVMFNLGYLPGGDHEITTRPQSTCTALDAAAELVRPGGVITVVAYTGHDGGREEADAVRSWVTERCSDAFRSLSYRFVNQPNDPPQLFAVEKRTKSGESSAGSVTGGRSN